MRLAVTCVYFSQGLSLHRGARQRLNSTINKVGVMQNCNEKGFFHIPEDICANKQSIQLNCDIFLRCELGKRLRSVYKQELFYFHLLKKLWVCLQFSPFILECGINDLSNLKNLYFSSMWVVLLLETCFSHYYVCLRFMQALLDMNDLGLFTSVFPSSSSVLRNIQVFLTRKQLRLTKITKE